MKDRDSLHVTAAQREGLQGAAHLPGDGVTGSPSPPLGEAPPSWSSPLTEAAFAALPSVLSVADGGLVETAVELVLSSPELTTRCGDVGGSGGGVQSEGRTRVCQSLEPGERVCWPPRN